MTDNPQAADLKLTVSPLARRGERIEASIDASNVTQTVVTLSAPDTVVISQPHTQVAGIGTFKQTVGWDVGKRGKTGGGMNLRFTGGHELDLFWECCRPPTSMAYRTPI